jgi:DNA-binding FadR family transcriptional regulator
MPEGGAGDSSAYRERLERRVWLDLQRAEKVPTILARRIQREIVERNLQPGDMLGSEAVMLARFGVGRASLREALRILENHGIVRIKPGPGGGPVVNEVTSNDWGRSMTIHLHSARATIRDLLEARMIMEPVVARLAAGRLTPEMEASVRTAAKEGHDALLPPPTSGRPAPRSSMLPWRARAATGSWISSARRSSRSTGPESGRHSRTTSAR